TNLVEANIDDLATPDDAERADALIIAAIGLQAMHAVGADPWDHPDGFRINGVSQSTFVFGMDGEPHVVRLTRDEDGVEQARIGAETFETDMATAILPQGTIVSGAVDGADVMGVVRAMTDGPVLFMNGRAIALRRPEYGLAMEGLEAGDDIRSPMP